MQEFKRKYTVLASFIHNFNNFKKEMKEIMKIVQALEDSNILLKGVAETIKNETKKNKKEDS